MKVIFIAIPTSGTVVNGRLSDEFAKVLARLHTEHPDCAFITPMISDYTVLPYLNVAPKWEEWGARCRVLLERSDEVWVLKFPGYDASVGVRGEIEHAQKHGIPVSFIDVVNLTL